LNLEVHNISKKAACVKWKQASIDFNFIPFWLSVFAQLESNRMQQHQNTNPLWIVCQAKTMIFRAGMSSLMSSSFAAVSPFCGQPYAPLTASAK
jgi:hypothetical protein